MGDWFEDLFGQTDREEAAAASREGALRPGTFTGSGGQFSGVNIGADGSVAASGGLGELEFIRALLRHSATGSLSPGAGGLPPEFLAAASGATGALGPVNAGASGGFDFSNALMRSGLFPQLQGQFQAGAQSAAQAANQPLDAVAGKQLSLLRQQAQPFEERAFSGLQDNLFATGRMGTTGGGIQTEAFARGLGQADLGRQLAAFDTARGVQSDAASRAMGFGSSLAGFRGLEDSLISSGFARGMQTSGVNADRALSRFGIAGNVLDASLRSRSAEQGMGLQALQGIQGLDEQGMQNFQAALNAMIARSNAQLGVGSNLASVAGSAGGFGRSLFGFLSDI